MKRTAIALMLGVMLASCAPAMNARQVAPGHPCYAAQQAEIERARQLNLGYGAGVFDETWFYSEGFERITWWGYRNMWWVSFESGGPLGGACRISRGST